MKKAFVLCILLSAIAFHAFAQGTIVYERFDPVAAYPIAAQWNIDFNHDGENELQISFSAYDLGYQWSSMFFTLSGTAQSLSPVFSGLSAGTEIGSANGQWASVSGVVYSSEFNGQNNTSQTWYALTAESPYLPLRFELEDGLHYGWVRFDTENFFGFQDWAYETRPDTAILAGAVPEPSTLSLGMLSALVLLFRKSFGK